MSFPNQPISIDAGTVVLPFTLVKVSKNVDKAKVSPGETLKYTIRVSNVGHKVVSQNTMVIKDTLDDSVTYVMGSMKFVSDVSGIGSGAIPDVQGGGFPLTSGYTIPFDIPRRGGTIDIEFEVTVNRNVQKPMIVNYGHLQQAGGDDLPFQAKSMVQYTAEVQIRNKVYLGHDGGKKCGTDAAVELVEDFVGKNAAVCFQIDFPSRLDLPPLFQ